MDFIIKTRNDSIVNIKDFTKINFAENQFCSDGTKYDIFVDYGKISERIYLGYCYDWEKAKEIIDGMFSAIKNNEKAFEMPN